MRILVKSFLFEEYSTIDNTINSWVKEVECTIVDIKAVDRPIAKSVLFLVLYLPKDEALNMFPEFDDLDTKEETVLDLSEFKPENPESILDISDEPNPAA